MKIVSIVGARPQFIKAATVSRVIRKHPDINEVLVHTGQHYDENLSSVFFEELDIPQPDYNLEIGSGSHAYQTGMMLQKIEEALTEEKPDKVMVYGDTNSTLSGALAAAKLHIPVAHVEAGLRSFNMRMPEEINRIVTDRISTLLFAPTRTAVENLNRENLSHFTLFTGDVMFDSILFYREKIFQAQNKFRLHDLPENFLLATVHRAENTDDPENLKKIFQAFSNTGMAVVIPLHPRTRKMITGLIQVSENIFIIEPVGYLEMLRLTIDATRILTDSGGLQKEAYLLGKACVTLRNETEWVETLHDNWNILAGTDPEKIIEAIKQPIPATSRRNEFGDGHAADRILKELLNS